MSRQYTTIPQVKNYVLLNWEESWDAQVTSWIEQMSKQIESITGRVFIADDEVRYFDGMGTTKLMIDDCISIYTIQIADDDITDYKFLPANALPKYGLYREAGFVRGIQNIVIDGVWGYSEEAPDDIQFACAILVAGIIQNQKRLSGEKKSESIGNYSVTYDVKQVDEFQRAMDILNQYKKTIV